MNLSPLNEKMLHGGDYNPDQWLDRPDILKQDIVLMKEAHVTAFPWRFSPGPSWSPRKAYMTSVGWGGSSASFMKRHLHDSGNATGARPAWMAQKYPEVLRVDSSLHRNHMGERHNHCYTSPVYREKARQINVRLSQAFGKHPGVILWHISNEIRRRVLLRAVPGAFRQWLKEKYRTLEALNHAWWTGFWSHTYTTGAKSSRRFPEARAIATA